MYDAFLSRLSDLLASCKRELQMKSNPIPSLSHPFPSLSVSFPYFHFFRTSIKDALVSHFFFFFIYSIQDNFHLFFLLFFFLCSFSWQGYVCVSYLAWLTMIIFPLFVLALFLSLSLIFNFIAAIKRKSRMQSPSNYTIPFTLKKIVKRSEKKIIFSHFLFVLE